MWDCIPRCMLQVPTWTILEVNEKAHHVFCSPHVIIPVQHNCRYSMAHILNTNYFQPYQSAPLQSCMSLLGIHPPWEGKQTITTLFLSPVAPWAIVVIVTPRCLVRILFFNFHFISRELVGCCVMGAFTISMWSQHSDEWALHHKKGSVDAAQHCYV